MSYPRVILQEECMREGMQIESIQISTADKVALLDRISKTGLKVIRVGSFVSPTYTPQMADIDAVVEGFTPEPGVLYTYLSMNERGRERAASHVPPLVDLRRPMLVCHLCDTFVRRNANRSQADEIAGWDVSVRAAAAKGVSEAGIGINAAFGSNFEGPFGLEQRIDMLARQYAMWESAGIAVTHLLLGDPMSWCMPHWLEETLEHALGRWPSIRQFHLHLHNARGMALPTIYAALRVLDDRHVLGLDVALGGIGGCPYCGNGRATGMAATEDVVHMLDTMGVPTDVDLDALIDAAWLLRQLIGRELPGFVSAAGPRPDSGRLYDPNLPVVETHWEARHFRDGESAFSTPVRPWRQPIPTSRSRRLL
jgi:hydroxymethylglutaryl-CoA lyase